MSRRNDGRLKKSIDPASAKREKEIFATRGRGNRSFALAQVIKKDKPKTRGVITVQSAKSKGTNQKKFYIPDTNILLHDREALLNLGDADNTVIIPITIIEELDRAKKGLDEVAFNSRQTSRYLDDIRRECGEYPEKGVKLKTGGILLIDTESDISAILTSNNLEDNPDNRILAVALKWQQMPENKNIPVIIVTNDTNFRLKAWRFGVKTEEYRNDRVKIDMGFQEKEDCELYDILKKSGKTPLPSNLNLSPNEFAIIRNNGGEILKAIRKGDSLCKLPRKLSSLETIFGIKPRNAEQELAFELLLDEKIGLISLIGKAGTGKTLLALAAGLHLFRLKHYRRITVARPVVPIGRDIGYLPGSMEEKLHHWLMPIFDNLEVLFSLDCIERKVLKSDIVKEVSRAKKKSKKTSSDLREDHFETVRISYEQLIEEGSLHVQAISHIRGRSLPNQFIIIDEAQNLTPAEIKTIITRAGEKTKIILCGDVFQIDDPYLDRNRNGLSYATANMKESHITGSVILTNIERSELAEQAANML